MVFPWKQMKKWTLLACLYWTLGKCCLAKPKYMVTIPAVLESGAETTFCSSLMESNETLVMDITLVSEDDNMLLFTHTSSQDFHICTTFKAPVVQSETERGLKVEVRGETYYSTDTKRVMIRFFHPITFVQTDKPIYLPGQTVHFRVITVDLKLKPANLLYNVIEIKDPHNNRIGQWLNESSNYNLLQHSYILSSEAREGLYKIIVTTHDKSVYYNFKVKKYVLPKFEVTLTAPKEVNIMKGKFEVKACVKYTYGQPVPAGVEAIVCRNLRRGTDLNVDVMVPCQEEKKQTDNKGCTIFTFKTLDFMSLAEKVLQDKLTVKVKVEEEGTGVSSLKDTSIQMSYIMGILSFIDTPTVYDRGSVVEGKVKAVYYNNTPIQNMLVYLSREQRQSLLLVQNLTTNNDGIAAFSLNTTLLGDKINLHVASTPKPEHNVHRTPHYQKGSHSLSISQDPSPDTKAVSFLKVKQKDSDLPCNSEEEIFIHYHIVGEARGSVDIMYLVLTGQVIVTSGLKNVDIREKSVMSFKFLVSADMAPSVRVVAYAVLPSETVVAHSATFSTEKCFNHKVSLEFSPSTAVPGEEINMQLSAQPHSLCGVTAVDRSVLIQDRGSVLDEEKIFNIMSARRSVYTSRIAQDPVQCLRVRTKRRIWVPNNRDETADVFRDAGLKVATNLVIATPTCLKYRDEEYILDRFFGFGSRYPLRSRSWAQSFSPTMLGSVSPQPGPSFEVPPPVTVETVRTYFPETWIWDLVEVGDPGRKDVSLKVPDTITTWETEAFCLSPQGFGLAPRQELTVFQPFFLELTLPYSIIRGENFELKATTFNYLSSCIMITVTPAASSDYALSLFHGGQSTFCLCGSERRTLRWTLVPSALGTVNVSVSAEAVASHLSCDNEIVSVPEKGRIDVVTRSLIVKAEGTERTKVHNLLLCPKGDSLREDIELQLPVDMIEGSARVSVSVLGDILGRALKNLDGMLRMPYGCGEQNMALLAPNIYILQYLKATQQLTPAILEKATNFLTSGYQRQLNYKHANGAYSTFGSGSGNTWLTAFVLRTLAKAQSFIYIDPSHVDKSTWLESKQKKNGCFDQSGKLFNNRIKGGVSDEVTLSAYITAAYLEMNTSANDQLVKKSLMCLKESLSDLSNTYTTALLAYVFTLAGDMETRGRLLQHLDTVAIREGGFLHWSQKASETSTSLSVEISSYVVMAKLSASPTAEDLGYTSSIVRWLTSQQNYYGGFSSTQDTVVALQALALYSTLVFSPDGSSTVVVQTPSGQQMFEVNPDNKLLYQEAWLQDVAGKYSLEVKGSACAAVQISLQYNIPTIKDTSSLTVEVTPNANCTMNSHHATLSLQLTSLYSGEQNTTNMVILDIKVLSGFIPDTESLKLLRGALLVDRVDQKEDHVLVYFQELIKNEAVTHTLDLVQEVPVQNLKPAVVKIYDYYQPSDQAETEYVYPCATATDQQ